MWRKADLAESTREKKFAALVALTAHAALALRSRKGFLGLVLLRHGFSLN